MLLHNKPYCEDIADTATRVPFNSLKEGDRFQHTPAGRISLVFRKDHDYITVRREDEWFVTSRVGDWVWDKEVIKVTPLRK